LSRRLFAILKERFSESEIKSLAFDIDVDFETLAHQDKTELAQALVQRMANKDKLAELEHAMRRDRPEAFTE